MLLISLTVFYFLYPKLDLDRYLLGSKEVNVDLSIKYLRALSVASQTLEERKKYKTILIDKLLYAGRFDEAMLEIENLEKEGYTKQEIAKFKFSIIKKMYLEGKVDKHKLRQAFYELYQLYKGDSKNVEFLLSEAIALSLSDFYKQLSEDLIKSKTIDKQLFFRLLDMSLAMSEYNVGEKLINTFGDRFIGDKEAELKMIKYLLMAGKQKEAAQLVNKIVNRR